MKNIKKTQANPIPHNFDIHTEQKSPFLYIQQQLQQINIKIDQQQFSNNLNIRIQLQIDNMLHLAIFKQIINQINQNSLYSGIFQLKVKRDIIHEHKNGEKRQNNMIQMHDNCQQMKPISKKVQTNFTIELIYIMQLASDFDSQIDNNDIKNNSNSQEFKLNIRQLMEQFMLIEYKNIIEEIRNKLKEQSRKYHK